ncbi:MAG TPA: FtsX-like permease family protein, partial [Bacilli bacterium]|nr:FtsX-like permease family protein [Bacilli bacterium]
DSQTALAIMEILKSISQKRLVILVTHNISLAQNYATRIIELLDGKIQKDSHPVKERINNEKRLKKTPKLGFFDTLRLSIKNMLRTKTRTLLSMIAGSIGIVGIGLVLSISKGVNSYIEEVQKSALGNYPITIMSQAKKKDEEGLEVVERESFPDGEFVSIREGENRYDYYNVMDEDFLAYMETLPPQLYTVIDYNTSIAMNILSQTATGYRKVSTSQLSEMSKDQNFVLAQYDVLKGSIPNAADEVAIIIDKYNCLDALTLYYLGIDYEGMESLSFDQLLSKQFKLLFNNDLYVKQGDVFKTKGLSQYESLYNNSQFSIKVTAIMREKKNANTVLYRSGLLYTPELTQVVYEDARQSNIYTEQLNYGLTKNVFTGQAYEDEVSFSSTSSKEYQLKQTYLNIGAYVNTNRIYVYTPTFADRLAISNFVSLYDDENGQVKITYYDYMNNVTTEFASLVKVFSTVLIIFSSVSLIVSAIMIGIITYVSIFERIRDIGILRSIGARKWDIATLFNFETLSIGFFSGLLGVLGVLVLVEPVNDFVKKMVIEYTVSFSGISQVIVAQFESRYIFLMVFGSMLVSFMAGLIPAVIASGKNPIEALKTER